MHTWCSSGSHARQMSEGIVPVEDGMWSVACLLSLPLSPPHYVSHVSAAACCDGGGITHSVMRFKTAGGSCLQRSLEKESGVDLPGVANVSLLAVARVAFGQFRRVRWHQLLQDQRAAQRGSRRPWSRGACFTL